MNGAPVRDGLEEMRLYEARGRGSRLSAMDAPTNRLSPRIRLVWWTVTGLPALVAAAAVWVAATVFDVHWAAPAAFTVLLLGTVALLPHLIWRRWRYEIRSRDLYLAHGYLFQTHTVIPFDRIQYVEDKHGPLDRFFGLTQVHVYTAAGKSGSVPGLRPDEAAALRDELSRVAGTHSV